MNVKYFFKSLKIGSCIGNAYLDIQCVGEKEIFDAYRGSIICRVTFLGTPFVKVLEEKIVQ